MPFFTTEQLTAYSGRKPERKFRFDMLDNNHQKELERQNLAKYK